MPPTNPVKTRKETLSGIPAARLQAKIIQFQADEDYLSHSAVKEDEAGSKWTLIVIFKDE